MALIKTKVPHFNGYRASVLFRNGIGRTDDTRLIAWFRNNGYIVETERTDEVVELVKEPEPVQELERPVKPLEQMTVEELRATAKRNGILLGTLKNREKLIERLKIEGIHFG